MKFLDEQITASISGFTTSKSTTYQYRVIDYFNTIVYVGNVYLSSGSTSVTIDITDIISNQKWTAKELITPLSNESNTRVNLINRYRVALYINGSEESPVYSNYVDLAMVYRYPNRKNRLENTFFDGWYNTGNERYVNCLQGVSSDGVPYLCPVVPYIKTNEYGFGLTIECNNNISGSVVVQGKVNSVDGVDWSFNKPSSVNYTTLSDIYDDSVVLEPIETTNSGIGFTQDDSTIEYNKYHEFAIEPKEPIGVVHIWTEDGFHASYNIPFNQSTPLRIKLNPTRMGTYYIGYNFPDAQNYVSFYSDQFKVVPTELTFEVFEGLVYDSYRYYIRYVSFSDDTPIDTGLYFDDKKVADVDYECQSKYYLMWQDRYGGFQSQQFSKTDTFSIKYTREEMKNYQNKRRYANMTIQPSWKIQTDWIDEEFYPYYESILVSPYLLLYDTEEDKSYNVIVTENTYTEKTYKNQRKFFNMVLNMELDKVQNILY